MAADTTTKFWTWSEIWTLIQTECDLEGADFVNESLAMSWANMAIDECEAMILTSMPHYFLDSVPLTLVSGTEEYLLPSTIYAFKINKVIYYSGTHVEEVKRLTTPDKVMLYRLAKANGEGGSQGYGYFIRNSTPGQPKMVFTPPPDENGQKIEIWFHRQANRISGSGDVIDIPEFSSYIVDYVRERTCWKEAAGSPRHQSAIDLKERTKSRILVTLSEMATDGAPELEADMSFYNGEHE